MDNKIKSLLCDLGISDEHSIQPFFDKVRDRDDVGALKCQRSGVIFLSRTDHMEISHYSDKDDFSYWGADDRKAATIHGQEDAERRFHQFKHVIANKKWCDVGTGAGGILDLMSPIARKTVAVEPQGSARHFLNELGYSVYPSSDEIPGNDIDVVTLFHVYEHITDPIGVLKSLKSKMTSGGKIIIEVPHARDFLISFLDLDAFKAFTLWSEHLILHTRDSLRVFLEEAGFTDITIQSFQRYPLANHLHWLAKSKPGGHTTWDHLRTAELDTAYGDMLANIDCADTLIAIAHKP